jgi:hypothetical protein
MAHRCGLDSLADRALGHRSQQHSGKACNQRRGDRSTEPSSSAGSKRDHRRSMPQQDKYAGWVYPVADGVDQVRFNTSGEVGGKGGNRTLSWASVAEGSLGANAK